RVDLEGKTMVPGFNDNHVHVRSSSDDPLQEWKGGLIGQVEDWIRGVTTIAELQEALREQAERTPEGAWITGSLSREIWPNRGLPTRYDLDEATTRHPILLDRGPHTIILNSTALEMAGIDRGTRSPEGGEVKKFEDGEPNGVLYDAAHRLVEDVAPDRRRTDLDPEQELRNIYAFMMEMASQGVTSMNIAGIRPGEGVRQMQKFYEEYGARVPRATMQVRLSPGYDTYDDLKRGVRESIEEMEALGYVTGLGNDRLKVGAIKMSIDGGLSAPVFWSTEEYENRPGFTGVIRIPKEAFYPVARRAHELGWQLGIHTMGDAAVVMVVDQMERILEEMPREDHRHYLHHVAVKPPRETIEKMARLGIGVASQPSFTVGLGSYAQEALSERREATQNPTGSVLDAGVWVSWGSDGAPYGPSVTLWTGITRKGWDGRVYGAQEEAVSRETALRLHTYWPAYQTFDENVKGTIEVGKLADFAVLGADYMTVDDDDIRYLPVERTIVGGEMIWSASGDRVADEE
nr:amidohydrolase [Gemmatimonadota bacterium]NIR80983.1 amidohydrolase [Gemmatimonadota bacterium]NIT89809.1 amidohydrolase [Gemmatimonadota bacterium]NIU33595.1 amidohydrolase [Gemmatimonadota bacterium]NIU37852.1 amidohydrolase family protein [Gemmatimonadota bacterium]